MGCFHPPGGSTNEESTLWVGAPVAANHVSRPNEWVHGVASAGTCSRSKCIFGVSWCEKERTKRTGDPSDVPKTCLQHVWFFQTHESQRRTKRPASRDSDGQNAMESQRPQLSNTFTHGVAVRSTSLPQSGRRRAPLFASSGGCSSNSSVPSSIAYHTFQICVGGCPTCYVGFTHRLAYPTGG